MPKTQDLSQGNVTRIIISFYVPMFFTNLLQQIYSFADTAIVGNGLGDNALASVGNMGSLHFLIIGFSVGLGNGFAILIARYFGAKDYDRLRHCFGALINLSVLIIVVLTVFSIVFLREALVIINTDEIIIEDSLRYGYIVYGGLCVTIAYNVSAAVLRALGDSKTPLYAIIVSTVANIVLDYIFIFSFKTGVEGAAIATIIAQLISAVMCIYRISQIDILRLAREDFKNDIMMYNNLLKNGVPMAFMNSLTAIGCMVVQSFVNDFGVSHTAAYSTCSRYNNMFMQPACTTSNTISAFAGQNCGAGKYDRIKKGIFVCIGIVGVSYMLLGSIMFFFPRFLASLLLKGDEAIEIASQFLRICGVALIFVDLLFVFRGAVQGMGYAVVPMLSGMLEMVLRISVIILLSKSFGFIATAYAEVVAWTGALMFNAVGFVYYYRKLTRAKMG